MRRRNLSRASRLPVAASPGTPFFSFFPFFSSLFFSLFAVENGKFLLLHCGVGERRSRDQLRRRLVGEQEDHPTQNDVLLLPVLLLSFFFFFYFGRRKWRIPAAVRRRGEAEPEQQRRRLVGEEDDHPTQNDVVLGWLDFFLKSKHPKTTSFWGYCFFKIRTPKTTSF